MTEVNLSLIKYFNIWYSLSQQSLRGKLWGKVYKTKDVKNMIESCLI